MPSLYTVRSKQMKRLPLSWAILMLSVGCHAPRVTTTSTDTGTLPQVPMESVTATSKALPLAARFPVLKSICDAAGGCENVEIICTKYDGSGNSILRNTTAYRVKAPIKGRSYNGVGFTENATPNCHKAIADAAENFWDNYRFRNQESHEERTVYPNHLPCKGDCFN